MWLPKTRHHCFNKYVWVCWWNEKDDEIPQEGGFHIHRLRSGGVMITYKHLALSIKRAPEWTRTNPEALRRRKGGQ